MALDASLALTTLATVKNELNIPSDNTDSDDKLERYIHQASEFIHDLIHRVLPKAVYVQDTYAGTGTPILCMRQWPILSVEEIVYGDDTLVSDEDFELTLTGAANGMIQRLCGVWAKSTYVVGDIALLPSAMDNPQFKVSYTAGYVTPEQVDQAADPKPERTLPYDIEGLVLKMIAVMFQKQCMGTQGQSSYKVGGMSITWDSCLDPCDQKIIGKYKRKWF